MQLLVEQRLLGPLLKVNNHTQEVATDVKSQEIITAEVGKFMASASGIRVRKILSECRSLRLPFVNLFPDPLLSTAQQAPLNSMLSPSPKQEQDLSNLEDVIRARLTGETPQ